MKCIIGWDEKLKAQYRVCKSTLSVDTLPTQNMFLPFSSKKTVEDKLCERFRISKDSDIYSK